MYAYLRRRYLEETLSEAALDKAVDTFKWITRQEATNIKAEKTRLENANKPPVEEPAETEPPADKPEE